MEINNLPEDIVGEIYSFVPLKLLSLTNKQNWDAYYKVKTCNNIHKTQSSYWRFLLRNDNQFVFGEYLVYYFPIFIKKKKIVYNSKIFQRKIDLMNYLSTFVFNSPKCRNIIKKFMKKEGLVFKKIKTKLNKWTS
mgnify:FL=1|jgi:hypothetical protein